jgi:hypothetical protein
MELLLTLLGTQNDSVEKRGHIIMVIISTIVIGLLA